MTTLEKVSDNLDSRRVPVNRTERAQRLGPVPYYGATGQVGWIDEWLFDEELCLVGEDGAPFLDRAKTKAYVISGRSWVNNHAHVLRAIEQVAMNRFLKHLLDVTDYRPHVNGTTRLKLTKSALNRIPVPLPPLNEQRRIVAAIEEHLSRLDAADASLAAGHFRLRQLRQRVIDSAADHTGQITEVREILTEPLANGRSVVTAEHGFPVLRLSALRDGQIDFSETKIGAWSESDARPWIVREGDFFVSRGNGSIRLVGRGGLAGHPPRPAAFPDTLIRLLGLCYSRLWKRVSWSRSTGCWQVRQRPAQQRRTGCRSSTVCGSVRPAAGLAGAGVPP